MTRTITLHFDQDDLDRMAVAINCQGNRKDNTISSALAYLSTWSMDYPVVDIYMQSNDEFLACYRMKPFEPGDNLGYVIGAVWDKARENFGFHS